MSLITIIPIEVGMLLSKITKESKNKKISLSLPLSEAIEHAPFLLYALIDKKKKIKIWRWKKEEPHSRICDGRDKHEWKKESHRWQHLSHIQTRLFSSLLRVTSFFFWGFLTL